MSATATAEAVLTQTEPTLIRVPFESLKRAAKERKSLLDEAQEAVAALPASGATAEQLDSLINKLHGLKRKLADVSQVEALGAEQCKARMEHLQQLSSAPTTSMVAWNQPRMARLLVDHMQRSGYHASAQLLAQQAGVQLLVDTDVHVDAQKVSTALLQHDCGPALAWCAEQRSRLKRLKSPLEFRLRQQQFVELVRSDLRMEAVAHAQAFLAPWAPQYMPELQRVMALLAFRQDPGACPAGYQQLYDMSQWEKLGQLFRQDLYRLHGLPPTSMLVAHLQAGISALNTRASQQPGCNVEDPMSLPEFQQMSAGLPLAKHVHSKLICSVTRALMSDANPPVVLPNGYVYSQAAVDEICASHGGRMVCPHTGDSYTVDELRRAFIV